MFGWCAPESEEAGVFGFERLYKAYLKCRRRKRNTRNAQRYEVGLLDRLWETEQRLRERTWQPGRAVFFIALKPKAREIHAADFADRVVHHALVPPLERLFEPVFIHDVYSNRKGKGIHAAAKRLQAFMKSALDRHGEAWFLQMDVRNFFNSIDRPLLFKRINRHLKKSVRNGKITDRQAWELSWGVHVLLRHHPGENVLKKGPEWTFDRVPPYKRLAQVGEHKGLPIGNLTSQFFANVYLNALDQFVKHELKCRYYLRYVDDWVIVHHDPRQLRSWRQRIEQFLHNELLLQLKEDQGPLRVSAGADFLGYVVKPGYQLVRRRILRELERKLRQFERILVEETPKGCLLTLVPDARDRLRAVLASYLGHAQHADSWRLMQRLWDDFPWLGQLYRPPLPAQRTSRQSEQPPFKLLPRWEPRLVTSLRSQWRYFKRLDPEALVLMRVGSGYEAFEQDALTLSKRPTGCRLPFATLKSTRDSRPHFRHCLRYPGFALPRLRKALRQASMPYLLVEEDGYLRGGMKRRVLRQWYIPTFPECIPSC